MSGEQLAADVLAVLLAVIVAGFPLGYWTRRRDPGHIPRRTRADRDARRRAQDDRDLLRLARHHDRHTRKARRPVKPTAAAILAATEDEQRDPDYCWTCGRKCGSQAHR
ncbi:hypothetical protein [Streptomyces sp. B21-101]|uniref:hypothetical protein n=1 Tax=Streptomyces sp. B21-101 TaxID=3039415 RepID=UPI002FF2ADFB